MKINKLFTANKETSSIFFILAYIYITVPFLIFLYGWFRLPLAIVFSILLLFGLFLAIQNAPKTDISMFCKGNRVKILLVVIIALIWVYLSGIGGFAYQNYDHMWRNAVLKTLVEEEWPVIIAESAPYFENPVALVYYFAFWLPSACVGKLIGLDAAHRFLFLWTVIGVLLVFYFISAFNKKLSVFVILAFIFFSGLDIVGTKLLNNSAGFLWLTTTHIENWAYGFQMSSLSTQLFWVFNQALPAWLITLLILHQKSSSSVVFIYSFSLMYSALPAVGLIPIVVYKLFARCFELIEAKSGLKIFKKSLISLLVDTFSFQNVIVGGIVGISSYLFLKINSTGSQQPELIDYKKLLMPYLIFVFLEFLVFFLATYRKQSKNGLWYLALITLLVVPFIKVGPHVDFVMRASIPALILLFVLVINSLYEYFRHKEYIMAAVLSILLILGSFTATHEILRSVCYTVNAAKREEFNVTANEIVLINDSMRDNFFGEYEDSIFFNYLAKK